MDLNSLKFLLFVIVSVAGYYIVPKKIQWIWLLISSYVYYAAGGWYFLGYLVFTTITTYSSARIIDFLRRKEERVSEFEAPQKAFAVKPKAVLVTGLVLNFGLLGLLKYSDFVIGNINRLTGSSIDFWNLAVPIGISFYIFQSSGYMLDVYWKRIKSEKNIFSFALFVSFFPQILQGPIGRFSRLASQLYEPHFWDSKRAESAIMRILWGFFKKLVIADTAAVFVTAFFDEYEKYPGTAVFAVLMYSIQLYADFSGGIDVVSGIAGLFGISLDENFRQPYFAVSITDFWHRWHITLGTWMKDYVFYPVSLSGWMGKFGKWGKKVFGRKIGRVLPLCAANLIVFFVVGVWHGAEWRYIVYGLYNGMIIAISGLLADRYRKWKKSLKINDKSGKWRVFCIVRTFILVNISWFLDRGHSVSEAFRLMKSAVTSFDASQLLKVPFGNSGSLSFTPAAIAILVFGVTVLFFHSVLKERGVDIAGKLQEMPAWMRVILYAAAVLIISGLSQMPSLTGGFIYAQF